MQIYNYLKKKPFLEVPNILFQPDGSEITSQRAEQG